MDNKALANALNHLFELQSRSLARHLEQDATPYLSVETYPIWKLVSQMAKVSQEHEKQLADLMTDLQIPLYPGVYQAQVANYHFVDLPTLIPQLIQEKKRQRDALQHAIEYAGENRSLLDALRSMTRDVEAQLQQLTEFGKPACHKPR